MSYKLVSPLLVIEGGTGVKLTTPYAVICGGTTNTGPLQFIASVGTSGQVLTSNGAAALPTFQNISAGSDQFDTDSGTATPSSGVINIMADTASLNAGASVSFTGSGNTVLFNVTDNKNNTLVGLGTGNNSLTGNYNTGLGLNVLSGLTTGTNNVAVGFTAGQSIKAGSSNVLIGLQAGLSYTSSESSNICIGDGSTGVIGESNVLRIGNGTGTSPGNLNQAFIYGIDGVNVGSTANVVTEVGNQLGTAVITAGTGITITPGANTITIAASGGGGATTLTGDDAVVVNPSGGNINVISNVAALNCGSSVEFTGSGNTLTLNVTDSLHNTIIGNSAGTATITGNHNIGLGDSAAQSATMAGNSNIMIGQLTGFALTDGSSNIMIGSTSGFSLNSGSSNIIVGVNAGSALTNGTQNVLISGSSGASLVSGGSNIMIGQNAGSSSVNDNANMFIGINAGVSMNGGTGNIMIGNSSGTSLTGGSDNSLFGLNAANSLGTGQRNVVIGANAATGYGSNESDNIVINDNGTAPSGQSNALVIGAGTGTGNYQLNQVFISGITGINVGAVPAVLVNSSNQLGVNTSTRKHKHNIEDMNDVSDKILQLRPVTFAYNNDPLETIQYGLIAEEVDEIFPDLVYRNKDNEIETVLYNVLPVLLLNEIKKLNARIVDLEAKL